MLRIEAFSGLTPRTGDRLLPNNGATEAANLLLTSGEIRPLRPANLVHTPSSSAPWYSVFRAEDDGVEKWLAWGKDVDIAKAPLSSDVEQRYYWTGDGEPRYTTFTNLPSTYYTLGVPTPTTAPSVSPSGGVGSNVTRFYRYTFVTALGEESSPSPVSAEVTDKVDATWAISGMSAVPNNSGTVTGVYSGGKTTFTDTNPHWLRVGDEVVINSTTLVVTDISGLTFKVAGDYSAYTTWARKAPWNTTNMYRRLYRTTGTSGSWQLVADNITSTTYNDTLTDAQIEGDELISDGWIPPPVGLKGLGFLPNGAAYGFVGNQLCFSEPYQPHAWPLEYQFGTDYEIIGASAFGTTVVAATAANPYVADGVEPASVTLQKVNNVWPCLSKRSVISVGDAVLYATSYGIAMVSSAGPQLWTSALYTIEEWSPLNPSSMVFATSEGRVFVAYTPTGGATAMLIFHPGEAALLTELSESPTELYTDPRNGLLYIVDSDGINQWNASAGEFMAYTWRSKEFELPQPVNLGAAKIDFTSAASQADQAQAQANYAADLATNLALITAGLLHDYNSFDFNEIDINGDNLITPRTTGLDSITFTLFVEGVEKFSRTVFDDAPFRLPSGYMTDNLSVQVSGTVRVKTIKLAQTMSGLRTV